MPKLVNLDYAVMILVEAVFFGDKNTAQKYDITPRTINNYRRRLNTDKDFSDSFQTKLEQYKTNWMENLPVAIRAGVDYLLKTLPTLGNSPEEIHAATGAIKILAEIGITKELLDAKLNQYRTDRKEDKLLPASESDIIDV